MKKTKTKKLGFLKRHSSPPLASPPPPPYTPLPCAFSGLPIHLFESILDLALPTPYILTPSFPFFPLPEPAGWKSYYDLLASLSLVSRSVRAIAQPRLWDEIHVTDQVMAKKFGCCHNGGKEAPFETRRLVLSGFGGAEEDVTAMCKVLAKVRGVKELAIDSSTWSISHEVLWMPCLENLEKLYLNDILTDSFPRPRARIIYGIRGTSTVIEPRPPPPPPVFSTLSTLWLDTQSEQEASFYTRDFLAGVLPNLETLILFGSGGRASTSIGWLLEDSTASNLSKLTTLGLESNLLSYSLRAALRKMVNIEALFFRGPPHKLVETVEDLTTASQHSATSSKKLRVTWLGHHDPIYARLQPHLTSLSKLGVIRLDAIMSMESCKAEGLNATGWMNRLPASILSLNQMRIMIDAEVMKQCEAVRAECEKVGIEWDVKFVDARSWTMIRQWSSRVR